MKLLVNNRIWAYNNLQNNFRNQTILKKRVMIKKFYYNKVWLYKTVKIQDGPLPTPMVKSEIYKEKEKYYIRIKLLRNFMSLTSNMYELKPLPFKYGVFGRVLSVSE